jgi:hypothetical protein
MVNMCKWDKKGLLFGPNVPGYSHASHPTIVNVRDDLFIVAFSCRDVNQKSHIFLAYAEVINSKINIISEPKMALKPGNPGYFDCDGLLSCCFVKHNSKYYLYYSGWQNLPDGLWICDTGRAIIDSEGLTASREFDGPVLARDKNNPIFAAATSVYVDKKGIWHTWYNSGIRWEKADEGWKPTYGIHYAHSLDGIDWTSEPGLIIPLADEYEHSFGRPSVVCWDNIYYMWFAHRGTKDYSTYRIGFASSKDGRVWERDDTLSGISISKTGWDSDSICYPYIFEHNNVRFMLYNGNNYGQTGFGYAVMESD